LPYFDALSTARRAGEWMAKDVGYVQLQVGEIGYQMKAKKIWNGCGGLGCFGGGLALIDT
jgi:hypothetical protein